MVKKYLNTIDGKIIKKIIIAITTPIFIIIMGFTISGFNSKIDEKARKAIKPEIETLKKAIKQIQEQPTREDVENKIREHDSAIKIDIKGMMQQTKSQFEKIEQWQNNHDAKQDRFNEVIIQWIKSK